MQTEKARKHRMCARVRVLTRKLRRAYRHHTKVCWIGLFLIISTVGFLHHQHHGQKQHSNKTLSVVVTHATQQDVPVYLSALGSVTPTQSVTVRTQVSGQLLRVFFKEGQQVTEGTVLAEIDPRPYEAQLTQYQGQLVRDEALLENARIDLKRYQKLWKQDSISQQTVATQESLVKQYEGTVKLDQGLIEATRLQLYYCRIVSPGFGRVGLRFVDEGNFVQPSDSNGLAVINLLNPITVVFTLAEDNIPAVMERMNVEKVIQVDAYDRQQQTLLGSGSLLTIDNQIDTSTGTIKLKAQFSNHENKLFPNQFVNVKLLLKTISNATVVPTAAIKHSQKGTYVYLIDDQKVARMTPVVVGVTIGDLSSVEKGVLPGQILVTEGADKLVDGAQVSVSSPEKDAVTDKSPKTKHGSKTI